MKFHKNLVQQGSHFNEDTQVDKHDKANSRFRNWFANVSINASWHIVHLCVRPPRNISPLTYCAYSPYVHSKVLNRLLLKYSYTTYIRNECPNLYI